MPRYLIAAVSDDRVYSTDSTEKALALSRDSNYFVIDTARKEWILYENVSCVESIDAPTELPGQPRWKVDLFGSSGDGLTYTPPAGYVPSFIQRLMCRVLLDCKWSKE